MEQLLEKKELGIYIHIPFCVRKCAYCDFLSSPATDEVIDDYFKALDLELEDFCKKNRDDYIIRSVFFGGGTPSIVKNGYIAKIIQKISRYFELESNIEITVEANPGTVTKDKLSDYWKSGVNRLSFGLQSCNDDELLRIGRIHTYKDFLISYDMALKTGFDNISVDIMSALPGQTLKSYENTLKEVKKLKTKHVSSYSLILEKNTALYFEKESGIDLQLPDEENERQMYYLTKEYLSKAGLNRYEISNYAVCGYESRHNTIYWTGVEYAGFGIGAASYIKGKRYTNISKLTGYILDPLSDKAESVTLTENDKMSEFMYLGLRMTNGILISDFKNRFCRHIENVYGDVINKYRRLNLLDTDGNRIWLTEKGIDVSNTVFADFLL